MIKNLLPFIYCFAVFILLLQAARMMFKGFPTDYSIKKFKKANHKLDDDRTGQITIHPEILNQDGKITDEDLLTVRFSKDVDPPQSADASAD